MHSYDLSPGSLKSSRAGYLEGDLDGDLDGDLNPDKKMNNRSLLGSSNTIASSIGSLSLTGSPLRAQPNFVDLSTAVDGCPESSQNDQPLTNSFIVDYCVGARVMRGPDWYVFGNLEICELKSFNF